MHAGGEKWLAELRSLTMLFVNFPNPDQIQFRLDLLQRLTTSLQKVIHRFGGSLKEWIFDDKGMSLVVAFGLPPASHEDDPYRAIQAALAIKKEWANQGLRLNLGLASGRVFCGAIGGERRREYAILGAVVNLASRLAGKGENDILCDQPTFQAAASRIQFTALPPMRLKGIARPIPAYRPVGLVTTVTSVARLVGHREEWRRLEQVSANLKRGEAFFGLIEGDPGIGKSTLIRQWSHAARRAGIKILSGAAESVHSTTPYFVWRPIVESILGLPAAARIEEQRESFAAICRGKDWERLSPLLEDVLELGIPDNTITAQMTGKSRADSTRELVTDLLTEHSQDGPISIILEDCHWMGSASLALAVQVAERVVPSAIILTSRPLRGDGSDLTSDLVSRPNLVRLRLRPLGDDDCVALVTEKLSVRQIAQPVAELIVSKSQGNPFFSEALTHSGESQSLRGHWRRFRAEALLGLGRLAESSQQFRQAAGALGQPVAEGKIDRRLRQQVIARISQGFRGGRLASVAKNQQLRELAAVYEMLSLLDLFANRMSSSLSAALDALDCAEQLGDSAEYARSGSA